MIDLPNELCRCKVRRVKVQVFNDVNASLGRFCRPCGARHVRVFDAERERERVDLKEHVRERDRHRFRDD